MELKAWGELIVKWSGVVAIAAGGVWGLYKWDLGEANDWMVNLEMFTEVLPYSDNLRLPVVHVRSKNPTANRVEFKRRNSTFTLKVQRVPAGLKPGSRVEVADVSNDLHPPIDLMADVGESYVFMPGAEFDDAEAVIVKANMTVRVSATLTRRGTPRGEEDFVSVERFVTAAGKLP